LISNETLVARIQDGEKELLPILWKQNTGLTRMLIRRYTNFVLQNNAVSFEDLEQTCFMALHNAVERYDAARGAKFATVYIWRAHREIQEQLGTTHNTDGVEYSSLSLNAPISEDDETQYIETVPDDTLEDFADIATRREIARVVWGEVSKLEPNERQVIRLIYWQGAQLKDIASAMGFRNTSAVISIQKRALIKLRVNPVLNQLVHHDDRKGALYLSSRQLKKLTRQYGDTRGCGLKYFRETGMSSVERVVANYL
jgi:RNA polymerase sigma factor (sigma-70 family)